MNKRKYVLGFLFDEKKEAVLLMKKNRPDFQKGLFNGLGGKVEDSDTNSLEAMHREFKEECGIEGVNWNKFCELYGEDYYIDVYSGIGNLNDAEDLTDEEVFSVYVKNLPENVMPQLRWLIPMVITGGNYIIVEL